MDRGEPEKLQFLGAIGILKEAFKILRSCGRLLNLITVTLVLPLSFVILGHTLVSVPLFVNERERQIAERELQIATDAADRAAAERILSRVCFLWTAYFLCKVGYLVFLLAFSSLSTAAVVYTVACMYTAKDVSYEKVMGVVPKVWKRLMVTFLWVFAIMLASTTAFVFASVFAMFFLVLEVGVANVRALTAVAVILFIVFLAVDVYISAIWHVASVISVLEDKYGIGAMQKSRHLIAGKRTPAFVLAVVYFVIYEVIESVFCSKVLSGNRHGVGVMSRAGYATILIALLSFVNLMGLLVQSVFYFVCKSYHHRASTNPPCRITWRCTSRARKFDGFVLAYHGGCEFLFLMRSCHSLTPPEMPQKLLLL